MASINEINFEDILNINGVNISTGASTDFTSWTVGTRPDNSTLSSGDVLFDTNTGRSYKWDSTNSVMLPEDVYGNSFSAIGTVKGDESSASDLTSQGTTAVVTAGAAITYNSTYIKLRATTGFGNASIQFTTANKTACSGKSNMYFRCVAAKPEDTGNGTLIQIGRINDATNQFRMVRMVRGFAGSTGELQRLDNNFNDTNLGSYLNRDILDSSDTSTHVFEMYLKPTSECYCLVDGRPYYFGNFNEGVNTNSDSDCFFAFVQSVSSYGNGNISLDVYEAVGCAW